LHDNDRDHDGEGELYGVLQGFPPNLEGDWFVGNWTFVANGDTEFEHGPNDFEIGDLVKVNSKLGSFTQSLKSAVTRLVRTDDKHMSLSKKGISSKNDVPSVASEEMKIEPDSFKMVYDPTHPDADESGYVAMPDINIISEMVEMMAATRAYEANVSAVKAAKAMYKEALNI